MYYDAKADAELVSAPCAGEGQRLEPHASGASGLCWEMGVGLSSLGFRAPTSHFPQQTPEERPPGLCVCGTSGHSLPAQCVAGQDPARGVLSGSAQAPGLRGVECIWGGFLEEAGGAEKQEAGPSRCIRSAPVPAVRGTAARWAEHPPAWAPEQRLAGSSVHSPAAEAAQVLCLLFR